MAYAVTQDSSQIQTAQVANIQSGRPGLHLVSIHQMALREGGSTPDNSLLLNLSTMK